MARSRTDHDQIDGPAPGDGAGFVPGLEEFQAVVEAADQGVVVHRHDLVLRAVEQFRLEVGGGEQRVGPITPFGVPQIGDQRGEVAGRPRHLLAADGRGGGGGTQCQPQHHRPDQQGEQRRDLDRHAAKAGQASVDASVDVDGEAGGGDRQEDAAIRRPALPGEGKQRIEQQTEGECRPTPARRLAPRAPQPGEDPGHGEDEGSEQDQRVHEPTHRPVLVDHVDVGQGVARDAGERALEQVGVEPAEDAQAQRGAGNREEKARERGFRGKAAHQRPEPGEQRQEGEVEDRYPILGHAGQGARFPLERDDGEAGEEGREHRADRGDRAPRLAAEPG